METVYLFRMFGSAPAQVDSVCESTARALAKPSEFDGDYYASRGGLTFACVLCVMDGIPNYYELADFKANDEQSRAAIEAAQEIF